MTVEVRIERLVVEGFDGLDGRALGRALEAELARRLAMGSLDPEHLAGLGAAPAIPEIALPAGAGPAAVGRAAAAAVGVLLRGASRSPTPAPVPALLPPLHARGRPAKGASG